MKYIFIFAILFISLSAHAQEGNNWYLGNINGINFNCAPPSVSSWLYTWNVPKYPGSGTTSMSDTNGSLLFFTDGRSVYNKMGDLMPNGHNVLANIDSLTDPPRHIMAVPEPGNVNRYYIFYTAEGDTVINGTTYGGTTYLSYVMVDMADNNGNGDVTGAYHHIENDLDYAITATRHRNKRDFWLLLFKDGDDDADSFVTYNISPSGLKRNVQVVVDSASGGYHPVFSNDGRRVAVYIDGQTIVYPVKLFDFNDSNGDFNDSNGVISNAIVVQNVSADINGLTFSPDNTKLYINAENGSSPYYNYLYQYDISPGKSANSINASKTVIYKNPANSGDDLQAAPDGKIYGVNNKDYVLWSINNPNEKGASCYFNPSAIQNAEISQYLPNFVTRHPEFMPYTVSAYCNNMPTVFTPFQNLYSPLYHWDFGDPGSGTADTSTKRIGIHLYKNPGTYKVHFVAWNYDSIVDTFTRFVCISEGLITAKLDTTLCSGETVTLDAGNPGAKYLWNTGDTVETKKVSSGIYWVEVSNGSCMITDTFHIAGVGAYTINLGRDTTLAKGKTLTLQTGYPTTIWSNGTVGDSMQVSQPGTYWAMLKGNKCSEADTIHILTPAKIDTNLCAGETITLDAGNTGARYYWNDGSTARTKTVSSGSYWVKISLSSFSITDSFRVIGLGSAKINLGKDTAIIANTTLTLHSGYQYAVWSTGQTGDSIEVTQAGTYWAALKGDKCAVSDTIHVTTYVPPLVAVDMDANVCTGETVTVDAGNPGATYFWWYNGDNTRKETLSAGTYWVRITNASGSITDTAHIIDVSTAKINLGKDTTIANGAVLVLNSGYPSATWSTGAKGDTIHVTKAGTYWAALIGDTCEVSDTIVVSVKAGIDSHNGNGISGFQLYPNPAHGTLGISFNTINATEYNINIYDITGKLVLAQKYSSAAGANTYDINISSLAQGDYILNMVSKSTSTSQKFEVGK